MKLTLNYDELMLDEPTFLDGLRYLRAQWDEMQAAVCDADLSETDLTGPIELEVHLASDCPCGH